MEGFGAVSPTAAQRALRLYSRGGLSSEDARTRLARYGPNRLVRASRLSAISDAARTFADPMALMLAGAAAVYYALGETAEATVLAIATFPVLAVDVILEARSRGALRKLALATQPQVIVIRDGIEREELSETLVPGDLMLITEGGIVHADAIVRQESHLIMDESPLTGEAEPVIKRASTEELATPEEDSVRVFAASRVIAGHAWAEVTETGERTRYGNLARLVAEAEYRPTPLQRKTARMVRLLVVSALLVSFGLFAFRIGAGVPPGDAFLYAVSVAMSAVGEEFVLVLTLFLSVGAWRLARRGVLVRRLASVETLGATTVICLDKTGTLTSGEFRLVTHNPLADGVSEDDLLRAAVMACEPNPADSIERTIVDHCVEHGVDVADLHREWHLVHDYPFDPIGKHMSHVWIRRRAGPIGSSRIVAKGALEGVLEHCAITPEELSRVRAANQDLASRGIRVLAVAGRDIAEGERPFTGSRDLDERSLRLYGLIGFQDPMRPEVPQAVDECQSAGIRLMLITGDHALTAHAVADAAGIAHRDDGIVTGDELDHLSTAELIDTVRRCSIFARVRPEQKFAIVEALAKAGEIVAMTGDGINDAPALRRADIGISMGRRATEVARSAADLVLLEDNFYALVDTIREGRRLYSDLQRAFLYLVGFKVMLVTIALMAPLIGLPLLLLPVDLVWLELIVHPVSALAFQGQRATGEDIMRLAPRPPNAAIVELKPALRSAVSGLLLAGAALVLYNSRLVVGEDYARTAAMVVVISGALLLVLAELAGTQKWWRSPLPREPRFWLVIGSVALSLPLFLTLEPAAELLMLKPIAARDWLLAIALSVATVGWRAAGGSRDHTSRFSRTASCAKS